MLCRHRHERKGPIGFGEQRSEISGVGVALKRQWRILRPVFLRKLDLRRRAFELDDGGRHDCTAFPRLGPACKSALYLARRSRTMPHRRWTAKYMISC